jgi:hypothetical protein
MISDNAILQEMIRLMFNHDPGCDQITARVLQRFFGNNRDGVGASTGL